MLRQHITRAQRQRVVAAAGNRCAYGHTAERVIGPFLEIDHIVPAAFGGTITDHNLTLACHLCNSHKSNHTLAAVYGWGDLHLEHRFYETAQGIRYTISEPAWWQFWAGCWL